MLLGSLSAGVRLVGAIVKIKSSTGAKNLPSPRRTWKLPGPLWKTWFHLQRPSGSFNVSLREGNKATKKPD